MRWAEVSTGVVTNITVSETEDFGGAWLDENVGGEWVLAPDDQVIGIGYTYYPDRQAFLEPQPYPSWTLNEAELHWDAPVAKPETGEFYYWSEDTLTWEPVPEDS